MEDVNPKGVNLNDYTPSNTAPSKCPPVGDDWEAKDNPLPPVANPDLCRCMMSSLGCIVNSDVDKKQYGDLFGTVCGYGDDICNGISHNATTGEFGAYSMCNPMEQLSFAFDQYQKQQGGASTACDFDGAATSQDAASPEGDCSELMGQAGEDGTGTVTSRPSGIPATTSKAAADTVDIPTFNLGLVKLGMYVVGAVVTGAGVLLF